MTKANLTEIVCIVDRSGSMDIIRDDAIGGFNAFVAEQKEIPGEAHLSLVLFNEQYEVPIDHVDLQQVAPLDRKTFVPRGNTALLDAMGQTIDAVGKRLAATAEEERPAKVIVVVLTDGEENASRLYSRRAVFDRIAQQREHYAWEFVFLAANQDAIESATALAIDAACAIDFTPDREGTRTGFTSISKLVSAARWQIGGKKKSSNTIN